MTADGIMEAAGMTVFTAAWIVGIGSAFVYLYHLVRVGGGLLEGLAGFLFKLPLPEGHAIATAHREKARIARKVFFVSWLVCMAAGCVLIGMGVLVDKPAN